MNLIPLQKFFIKYVKRVNILNKKYTILGIIIFSILFLVIIGNDEQSIDLQNNSDSGSWIEHANNPVIRYGYTIENFVWNDPSVIKENEIYRMWLIGGNPNEWPIKVSVHHAISNDGIDWTINPVPVLSPEFHEDNWDSLRIETPSVIKVDDMYHLYYGGCNAPCDVGKYSIGHATSKNGIDWKKDPNNPIITYQDIDPLKWGFYTAAEPTVTYNENEKTFYLYYVSHQARYPDDGSSTGILLSTSKDGSFFLPYINEEKEKIPVLDLSDNYDYSKFRGMSTPMVYIKDDVYHLYYDMVYDPNGFQQVAISHAISSDGMHFNEIESNIVVYGDKWNNKEVNGPTVIDDDGIIKMWFAGQVSEFPPSESGIGYIMKPKQ